MLDIPSYPELTIRLAYFIKTCSKVNLFFISGKFYFSLTKIVAKGMSKAEMILKVCHLSYDEIIFLYIKFNFRFF